MVIDANKGMDVKPDNIPVNWSGDQVEAATATDTAAADTTVTDTTVTDTIAIEPTVTKVALGDFDIAYKLQSGESRQTPYAIGNAMWRSPEGQTGRGVTKASDIFSFGLVASSLYILSRTMLTQTQCIYALGGGELLMLDASTYQSLVKDRISPEQETLLRHFAYFGPVSEGLLQRIDSEVWATALKGTSRGAEMAVKAEPGRRFEVWGQHFGLGAQSMISGMTAIDPATRITIDEVLAHRWWQEAT